MNNLDTISNNGSFCVLPFVHQEKKFNGTYHICCYSDQLQSDQINDTSLNSFNSKKMINLRSDMISDIKNSSCNKCYELEENNIYSPRLRENSTWLGWLDSQQIVARNVKKHLESELLTPLSYDLRYSNTCALKCRMCNSSSSSAINQEYSKLQHIWPEKFWVIKNPRINHDIEIDENIQKIYLAGGEPLVEPYNLELLKELSNNNSNVNLLINTSLNNLNQKFLETLNKFTNLTLVISIDGVGVVNDYIRHGSKFDQIISNIKKMYHHNMMFSTCVSMYNVFNIAELYIFIKNEFPKYANNHSFNLIDNLEELEICNTPYRLRPQIIDGLNKVLTTADELPSNGIKNIINVLQKSNFKETNFQNFLRYTKILDVQRNETINLVVPELENYFNE